MKPTSNNEYLFSLEIHGIKLGLDNIRHLLNLAGNPQDGYPAVHIAGTNGKGSVAAMLDAIVRAAGYKTGRFTSPHLIDVAERFIVNGAPIPHGALDEQIAFFRAMAESMEPAPTFFEMNTAIAFRWFQQNNIDLGIIEVGMGGRLDSTNVITPCATAITTIDLEHTRYLGDTIEQIAYEKAGIIKPDVPVVVGETKTAALGVILARAEELRSSAHLLGRDFSCAITGEPFQQRFTYEGPNMRIEQTPLSLAGAYQSANAAVAVALAGRLTSGFPRVDRAAIQKGLNEARWPCRLEKVMNDPPVIIDVAHNPAGARTLARELPPCVILLAVSADKDASGMIAALDPIATKFILTQFDGPRALSAQKLSETTTSHPSRTIPNLREAVETGLRLASAQHPLLITGSIFTAGQVRQILTQQHGAPPLQF